jgi:hypothetical protein
MFFQEKAVAEWFSHFQFHILHRCSTTTQENAVGAIHFRPIRRLRGYDKRLWDALGECGRGVGSEARGGCFSCPRRSSPDGDL